MERAKIQFPAYMNRVYGRKTPRPYEIPNLNLFPQKRVTKVVTEDVKLQIKSGVIHKVSVQSSSNTLPSVGQISMRRMTNNNLPQNNQSKNNFK